MSVGEAGAECTQDYCAWVPVPVGEAGAECTQDCAWAAEGRGKAAVSSKACTPPVAHNLSIIVLMHAIVHYGTSSHRIIHACFRYGAASMLELQCNSKYFSNMVRAVSSLANSFTMYGIWDILISIQPGFRRLHVRE